MRFVAILKLKSLGCSDSLFMRELWHKGLPILATHYDKSIGGCQGAERRGVFDFFTEILLPDTVEQALAVFDFYLAQQNQVTDNRIRQVTSPCIGLCISDGT